MPPIMAHLPLLLAVATVLLLSPVTTQSSNITWSLTDHFINWLDDNGYQQYNFQRNDTRHGSYGGKLDDDDEVINQPVIFIHGIMGNADDWEVDITYFESQGYKEAELYATTWGHPFGDRNNAYYSEQVIMHVRKFAEAVIEYTSAEYVDVIAHSMGVPISRKIIKGGSAWDNETYDVGDPLTDSVDTWIGLAGVNLGANSCANTPYTVLGCNTRNGNYPGIMVGTSVVNRSEFLQDLLEDPGFEGQYRYVMLSLYDDALLNGDLVYCNFTSRVPLQTDEKIFKSPKYTHVGVKDLTAPLQLQLITNHIMD